LVHRLQYRIGQTCAPVQKAAFAEIQDEKLQHRAHRYAIEQFLLMKAAFMKIARHESFAQRESSVRAPVLEDLSGLQSAVGVMSFQPMVHPLAEGKMVKISRQAANWPVRN